MPEVTERFTAALKMQFLMFHPCLTDPDVQLDLSREIAVDKMYACGGVCQ